MHFWCNSRCRRFHPTIKKDSLRIALTRVCLCLHPEDFALRVGWLNDYNIHILYRASKVLLAHPVKMAIPVTRYERQFPFHLISGLYRHIFHHSNAWMCILNYLSCIILKGAPGADGPKGPTGDPGQAVSVTVAQASNMPMVRKNCCSSNLQRWNLIDL